MSYVLSDDLPEMKRCPFCGREPTLQQDTRYPKPECEPKKAYEVVCNTWDCPIRHADNSYWFTPEEAIKAWNRRRRRDTTAHWIFGSTNGHSWMKCSECCVSQDGQRGCWSYCPNCGAEMSEVTTHEEG